MIKIIKAGFLVVVFGLEAEVAFGGAGLGEEVAEGLAESRAVWIGINQLSFLLGE